MNPAPLYVSPFCRGIAAELLLFLLASLLPAHPCQAQQPPAPDERSLWLIWKQHADNPDDHAAAIAACADFAKKSPGDPFAAITDNLQAWHLLKTGDTDSARAVLERLLPARTDPLRQAGSDMARGWLTRIDREKVRQALQAYYSRQIEYPPSLDALKSLPDEDRPPMTDRWGKNWSYRLVPLKMLKDIQGQKYEVQSSMLGRDSDLARALEPPYGSKIRLTPVKMASAGASEAIQFVTQGDKPSNVYLSPGGRSGAVMFVFSGQRIIVLADGEHWQVLPKPK